VGRGAHLIASEISDDGSVTLPPVLGGVSPSLRLLRDRDSIYGSVFVERVAGMGI
jgi:hypothetical protein